MPKGQYPRKPRNPAPEAVEPVVPPLAAPEVTEAPAERFHFEPNEVQARMMAEEREKAPSISDQIRQSIEDGTFSVRSATDEERRAVGIMPDPEPPPSYDGGMVSAKVHAWAGAVCNIRHEVSWQPVRDSRALEVLLITEHGASRLTAPAGNWTASDIDQALEAMRADLMV